MAAKRNDENPVLSSYSKFKMSMTSIPSSFPDQAPSSLANKVDSTQAVRAVIYGYDSAIPVIRYILCQIEAAGAEEARIDLTTALFQFINKNHIILVYESELRSIIIEKMNTIETNIKKRFMGFGAANYKEALDMMRTSIWTNVHHSAMRAVIEKNLAEIRTTLAKYEKQMPCNELINEFNTTRALLNTIKYHPDYVA
jgi:hypothetical protein